MIFFQAFNLFLALFWTFSLVANIINLHAHATARLSYKVGIQNMMLPAFFWTCFYVSVVYPWWKMNPYIFKDLESAKQFAYTIVDIVKYYNCNILFVPSVEGTDGVMIKFQPKGGK